MTDERGDVLERPVSIHRSAPDRAVFVEEGNAKRPVVAYDEIVFDFAVSLDSERDRTDEPAAA